MREERNMVMKKQLHSIHLGSTFNPSKEWRCDLDECQTVIIAESAEDCDD